MDMHEYLLSPLDTNPMLSRGSCLTGRNLSHGAEDIRPSVPRFGGPLAMVAATQQRWSSVGNNQRELSQVVRII